VHSGEWWKANGNGTAGTSLKSGPAWCAPALPSARTVTLPPASSRVQCVPAAAR
jgi:hypothetical protein